MKKLLTIFIFTCFAFQFVDAAHYFNQYAKPDEYYNVGKVSLVRVKADHNMGTTLENEDRFWFDILINEDIKSFKITIRAMDGTNDADKREYSWSSSSLPKGVLKTYYCGNFPTYVDNVKITIEYYDSNNIAYQHEFYVYSTGDNNQGSGTFAVADSIPDNKRYSDGTGVWDSNEGVGGLGNNLIKFVKVPYNFFKWLFGKNTQIMLMISFLVMFVSVFVGLRLPPAVAWVMFIPFGVGLYWFSTTILEGFNIISMG